MKPKISLLLLLLVGSVAAYSQSHTHERRQAFVTNHSHQHTQNHFFIANKGQWADKSEFRSNFSSGRLSLFNDRFFFAFLDQEKMKEIHDHVTPNQDYKSKMHEPINGHAFEVQFVNAQSSASIHGLDRKPTYHNYFKGNDRSTWASRVPLYEMVEYKEVWNYIDIRIFGTEEAYKTDYILHPGANPEQLKLHYEGVTDVFLRDDQLWVKTTVNEVMEYIPEAYQIIDGQKVIVPCEYTLSGNVVGFSFPKGYNPKYTLVIDPELIFARYSGSFGDNWGMTATPGNSGSFYGAGIVFESGYPTTTGAFQTTFANGATDVAISKYASNGEAELYSTYLGGSETEVPHSMIVDAFNNLVVYGTTSSANFPGMTDESSAFPNFSGGDAIFYNGINYGSNGSDIFIVKFSVDGSDILAATYYGGSENDGINEDFNLIFNYGDQARGEVIVDELNKIYIASSSQSNTIPGSVNSNNGNQDGIVAKFSSDLESLEWARFLGGSSGDACYSMKVNEGNVFVCGGTTSSNFPTSSGAFDETYNGSIDGYIARLSASNGNLFAATYVGTNQYDQTYFIDYDFNDDIYVLGQSKGDYPISPGVYANPGSAQFIHKFTEDLDVSLLSTTIGDGTNFQVDFSPSAFMVDEICRDIYISGWGGFVGGQEGNVIGLPLQDPIQSTTDGTDFYFMQLKADMAQLLFASYFGGPITTEHVDGGTSRFDRDGIIYQAVCASCGGLQDFPTTTGPNNNAFNCNLGSVKLQFFPRTVIADADAEPSVLGCSPYEVDFTSSFIAEDYVWSFGDGSPNSFEQNPTHTFTQIGDYLVRLIVIDSNTCNISDSVFLPVTIFESPVILETDFEFDCENLTATFTNSFNSGEDRMIFFLGCGRRNRL
jgi:hypothetical protein